MIQMFDRELDKIVQFKRKFVLLATNLTAMYSEKLVELVCRGLQRNSIRNMTGIIGPSTLIIGATIVGLVIVVACIASGISFALHNIGRVVRIT